MYMYLYIYMYMYVNIIYMYLYIYIHFPVHNFDKFLEGSTDFVRRAGGP